MPLVLDASVALCWAFDTVPAYADHVLGLLAKDDALVPPIWPAEVANGLLSAERGRRLGSPQRAAFLNLLRQLDVIVEATGMELTLSLILDLARVQGLTVYDAMYLEMAVRDGIPLATLDDDLRNAATRLGVPLVGWAAP